MHLPHFLRRDPAGQEPEVPQERARGGRAARGALIGCLAALVFWAIPLPVVAVVWAFDLEGPFGDTMLLAIPCYLALPFVGAAIGARTGRRRGAHSWGGGSR